jgi:hypothetical protein
METFLSEKACIIKPSITLEQYNCIIGGSRGLFVI